MNDIYLLNYSVKGIKTLDQQISLSFYKKSIEKEPDTQEYNIKGIYGMNGSGKSGIITSVEILKNLLMDSGYLNNPIAQKNLDAMINKKTGELSIEADYLARTEWKKGKEDLQQFQYSVTVSKDEIGKFVISGEKLKVKRAVSKGKESELIFHVSDGELLFLSGTEEKNTFALSVKNKTMNLLKNSSMSALFCEKFLRKEGGKGQEEGKILKRVLCILYLFGEKLHVYLDQSDEHREFVSMNFLENLEENSTARRLFRYQDFASKKYLQKKKTVFHTIAITKNPVPKESYRQFERTIDQLYTFLHIFKSDLQAIEIDRKEDQNQWICDLIMVYDSYKIHAEYESTGIKKLIRLFAYLNEMVHGGIVFIDEFDSNLHDVYLCALLEYLMEYGKGQLCFTTHNVGPMDILKQRKKSIDFLSEDHKIYPWTKSGNYSPSRLYRNGMIEGSPFNVDSIDFIRVFGSGEEDEEWEFS